MSVGTRIAERLKALGGRSAGFSQSWLARETGLGQSTINELIHTESAGTKHLPAIAKALQTTVAYLAEQTDDPGAELPPLPVDFTKRALDVVMIRSFAEKFALGGGAVLDEDDTYARDVAFPRVFLGGGRRRDYADHFLIKGEGDSMITTIFDGDDILVDGSARQIDQQDRIWALGYADLGMVKRVLRLPNGELRIKSDNPAVPPFDVAESEIRVLGRVKWIGRRV